VLTGHAHLYERLSASGFPYIVNGLGGEDISTFNSKTKLPTGVRSVVRYNSDFGAMLVNANTSGITYQFYSAGGNLIDTYSQSKNCSGVSGSPAASLSPTSLTFPSQTVGTTSAAQAVTLSNSGNAPLSITSIAITGTNAGNFAQTNNCPFSPSTLAAGANCTINTKFTPSATGTRSATLSVSDNAAGSPQTVSLTGTGASSTGSPAASLSLTALAFGNQGLGSPQIASLTGTGVTATGSGPAFVQIQNNIDVSGAAFTSFSVNITTQAGNLLVAFCRESSNGTDNFTVTDSAGQTWTQTSSGYSNESGTGPRSGMFYVANPAAVTSVRVNYATAGGVIKPGIMVFEISGAASSLVADGSVNNGTAASTTTSTSGSLTTR